MFRSAIAAFALVLMSAPMASAAPSTNPADMPAGTWVVDKTHASLIARVRHMGLSAYTVRFTDFDAAYVYDAATIRARCASLKSLRSVARVLYAIKANSNPEVLRLVHAAGVGIECVSRGEAEHALRVVAGLAAGEILFTPNFAPRAEYECCLLYTSPSPRD